MTNPSSWRPRSRKRCVKPMLSSHCWFFFFPRILFLPLLNLDGKSLWNADLLPRRSHHCQGENQQRHQQGREENQSVRWSQLLECRFLPSSFPYRCSSLHFSGAANKRGALLIGHLHQGRLHWGVWVSWWAQWRINCTIYEFFKKCNPWLTGFLSTLQGDSKLQLHPGEDIPNHSSAGQQQGEAWPISGRTAKRRGHPPGIHHPVSHPARHFEGEGLSRVPRGFVGGLVFWSSYWVSAHVE